MKKESLILFACMFALIFAPAFIAMEKPEEAQSAQVEDILTSSSDEEIDDTRLLWLGCKVSGYNPSKDRILEVAAIITDTNLKVTAQTESLNIEEHLFYGKVEDNLLTFLKEHGGTKKMRLCGSNKIMKERALLKIYMPFLEACLSNRTITSFSISELCSLWYNDSYQKPKILTAYDEAIEAINRMRYYKTNYFKDSAE